MPGQNHQRRHHERIRVQPMYTAVIACPCGRDRVDRLQGHVYDISNGGVRIELDEALDPGDEVALQLDLPGAPSSVAASASVIWVHDEQDDPGPRRMALRFTEFCDTADRDRLAEYIDREGGRRAA